MQLGLKTVDGLHINEDSTGFQYIIPLYVINEPLSFGNENPGYFYPDDVCIKLDKNPDVQVVVNSNEVFSDVKKKIAKSVNKNTEDFKLKYGDEFVKDDDTAESLRISNFGVVSVVESKNTD